MQYYVSNLNYMNHLLKLIRETNESGFFSQSLHFKFLKNNVALNMLRDAAFLAFN